MALEEGFLVGYAALIQEYSLQVPLPEVLSIISHKHRQYSNAEWRVFTPRHKPEDSLIGHLTFALKYEGIELYLLKKVFETIMALDLPDLAMGNYVELVDTKLQYGLNHGIDTVKRHIILKRLDEYRRVLEAFSVPRMDMIEWRPDDSNNIEVLNETADLYQYFDVTKQAEFLYDCVRQTFEQTIPEEVGYLEKYDLMKDYLDNLFEMPDKTVALLIRFLEQGNGRLSERVKSKEFSVLMPDEVQRIEERYQEIFHH